MVAISSIPRKTKAFFKNLAGRFSQMAFDHFWGLVLAMTISQGATIERLAKLLCGSTHGTNHSEFVVRSE